MEQIKESLRLYIEHRIQPGSFLTAKYMSSSGH